MLRRFPLERDFAATVQLEYQCCEEEQRAEIMRAREYNSYNVLRYSILGICLCSLLMISLIACTSQIKVRQSIHWLPRPRTSRIPTVSALLAHRGLFQSPLSVCYQRMTLLINPPC